MAPFANFAKVTEHHGVVDGYILNQEIGQGNFGQVFACPTPDGRVVAVKKMPKVRFPPALRPPPHLALVVRAAPSPPSSHPMAAALALDHRMPDSLHAPHHQRPLSVQAKQMSIRKMARFAEGLRILMEPDPARRHPNILYIERAIQSSSHFYLVTSATLQLSIRRAPSRACYSPWPRSTIVLRQPHTLTPSSRPRHPTNSRARSRLCR